MLVVVPQSTSSMKVFFLCMCVKGRGVAMRGHPPIKSTHVYSVANFLKGEITEIHFGAQKCHVRGVWGYSSVWHFRAKLSLTWSCC